MKLAVTRHAIEPGRLHNEQLDAFMAEFCRPFSPGTCGHYRTIVRGFLSPK
jgi:hypothetical protein